MKRCLNTISILVALLAAVALHSGCRENTLIKTKVLPTNDTVGVHSYSLPCVTHTYYDGFAITSTDIGGIPIYQGVGVYEDPFFGTMTGATFFQVVTTNYSNPFSDLTVDSAILVLPYSGFTFGDTSDPTTSQTYQVFYLQDTLSDPATVNYFASTTKPIDLANPLSDPITVNLKQLRDSFGTNTLAVNTPGLRVKLRLPALFKYLGPAVNILSGSSSPIQDFVHAFHGICVMPANTRQGSKAIPYFKLDGTNAYNRAGFIVYYRNANNPAQDTDYTEQYYFTPSLCSHFNSVTRSYSRYPVNSLLTSTQTNDSIITLQNQPGTSIDVVIPGITSLPKNVVINNAQLQLRLIPTHPDDSSLLPERLYPIGIGSATYPSGVGSGVGYNLADRYPVTSLSPLSFMGGFYHTVNVNGTNVRTYTLNLPREVMNSIAAKNDTLHIHISGTEDYYGAFQMKAGGGSYSDTMYRPRLIVVYSKL